MENKTVGLEAVRKFVAHKMSKPIKLVESTGGDSPFFAFVDSGIQVKELTFTLEDEFEPLKFIDSAENNVGINLYCMLFKEGDLVNDRLSLKGARNGVLVIDGKFMTQKDIDLLDCYEFLKADK